MNKKKIINDPVYGFITIRSELIFDIINHPCFQRLRRIKQMGLAELVYPGAHHTRFHHALGAMHLMCITLDNLRNKGVAITDEEYEGASLAILLHDIGHGPFSPALEFSLLKNIVHEQLSRLIISNLNREMDGQLSLALDIFNGCHPKQFLNELVSSQLDIDRLDYLKRDSFFSGVSEGTIGADRIIKMLDVKDGRLVVEEKGIYSIENFLSARRLMYWQVYLHKAGVAAEKMLIKIIERARKFAMGNEELFASPPLRVFLTREIDIALFAKEASILENFVQLDDYDIWGAIKMWTHHPDRILSSLCQMLLNRNLFRIKLTYKAPDKEEIKHIEKQIMKAYGLKPQEAKYFFSHGKVTNNAYKTSDREILILSKSGRVRDVVEAADLPNIKAMSKMVCKYYRCWPKDITL